MTKTPVDANGTRRLRFGDYELDSGTGKLLRDGRPVKIQPPPLRALSILVQRPDDQPPHPAMDPTESPGTRKLPVEIGPPALFALNLIHSYQESRPTDFSWAMPCGIQLRRLTHTLRSGVR